VSFFDEGDQPTRVTSRPSRPSRGPRPRPGASRSGASRTPRGAAAMPDRQTLMVRRAVAAGAVVIVLVLLVLGIKGCVDNQRESALKDYNRDVSAVVTDSDREVARPFFNLLNNAQRQSDQLTVQVNQLRLAAEEDARRAREFDTPDDMRNAQADLELVLNLRADALRKISGDLPAALGRGQPSEQAIDRIAGQMQQFLASDVVYKQRVAPLIKQTLDENRIQGQTIANSRFLADLSWLAPETVADKLGRTPTRGTTTVAPGLHGHGLTGVSVGDTTLQPSPTVNRVSAAGNVTFTVNFANQGDNDERDVRAIVTIHGAGKPITARKTVAQTTSKTDVTAEIPLGQRPPLGQATTVDVTIARVPGETNTDNNSQSYTVIFTG
jgi:hypothetical protein